MALPPERDQPPVGNANSDRRAERKAAEEQVLLREIDEAVREDQMAYAARRYGVPAFGAVLAALALFGGYLWWDARQEAGHEATSEQLVAALDHLEAGNIDTGAKALEPLTEGGSTGARTVARLTRAGIALGEGRDAEAAKLYAEVAKDSSAPQPYRDLATIREVALGFESLKPEDVISRLKPLAVPGNPWFGSAGELVGMAYLKQDKKDLAGPLFAEIAKADNVPETLRARARQLAGLLGVDAVVDVDALAGGDELQRLPATSSAPVAAQ